MVFSHPRDALQNPRAAGLRLSQSPEQAKSEMATEDLWQLDATRGPSRNLSPGGTGGETWGVQIKPAVAVTYQSQSQVSGCHQGTLVTRGADTLSMRARYSSPHRLQLIHNSKISGLSEKIPI